jgi:hypothetical protein
VDRRYIEEWSERLGLTEVWDAIAEQLGDAGEFSSG